MLPDIDLNNIVSKLQPSTSTRVGALAMTHRQVRLPPKKYSCLVKKAERRKWKKTGLCHPQFCMSCPPKC